MDGHIFSSVFLVATLLSQPAAIAGPSADPPPRDPTADYVCSLTGQCEPEKEIEQHPAKTCGFAGTCFRIPGPPIVCRYEDRDPIFSANGKQAEAVPGSEEQCARLRRAADWSDEQSRLGKPSRLHGSLGVTLVHLTQPAVVRAAGPIRARVEIGRPLAVGRPTRLARKDVLSIVDARGLRVLKGPGTLVDGVFTPANEKARDSSRIEGSIPGIVLGRTPNRADGKRYLLTRYEWAFELNGDMRVCLPAGMMPLIYDRRVDPALPYHQILKRVRLDVSNSPPTPKSPYLFEPGETLLIEAANGQPATLAITDFEPVRDTESVLSGMDDDCRAQVELNAELRERDFLVDAASEAN